jgi:hypothetical protein
MPWISWDEWEDVRQSLFILGTDQSRASGIRRIRVWQSRCKIPHSIEATAALFEIGLARERSLKLDGGSHTVSVGGLFRSEEELRLMYSMALLRLVNGVVDSFQQKKFASPVSDLAEKLALPRVLVDVRHAATHNQLPTLATLLHAAELGLSWLRVNYWDEQVTLLERQRYAAMEPLKKYVKLKSRILAAHNKLAQAKRAETQQRLDASIRTWKTEADALLCAAVSATPPTAVEPFLVPVVIRLATAMQLELLSDAHAARVAADGSGVVGRRMLQAGDVRACAEQVLSLWDEAAAAMGVTWRFFRPALVGALGRAFCAADAADRGSGPPADAEVRTPAEPAGSISAGTEGPGSEPDDEAAPEGVGDGDGGDGGWDGLSVAERRRGTQCLVGLWLARLLRADSDEPAERSLMRATLRAALLRAGVSAEDVVAAVVRADVGLRPAGVPAEGVAAWARRVCRLARRLRAAARDGGDDWSDSDAESDGDGDGGKAGSDANNEDEDAGGGGGGDGGGGGGGGGEAVRGDVEAVDRLLRGAAAGARARAGGDVSGDVAGAGGWRRAARWSACAVGAVLGLPPGASRARALLLAGRDGAGAGAGETCDKAAAEAATARSSDSGGAGGASAALLQLARRIPPPSAAAETGAARERGVQWGEGARPGRPGPAGGGSAGPGCGAGPGGVVGGAGWTGEEAGEEAAGAVAWGLSEALRRGDAAAMAAAAGGVRLLG